MKTIDAIIALSLGISAAPLQANECKFVIGGNEYTVQQIMDKVQNELMFYANVSDKAEAKSGNALPPNGRIIDSKRISKSHPPGFTYLGVNVYYDRSDPGKGIPLEIKVAEVNIMQRPLPGTSIYSIVKSPDGTYSSPHCK